MKISKLILVAIATIALSFIVAPRETSAQTYKALIAGSAADTAHASTTLSGFTNVNADNFQTVIVQCRIDSLSGTPAGTAKLYSSIDGTNWDQVGSTKTWTFISASDTVITFTATSFPGVYAKVSVITTSGTQKIKARATLKSWNQ